MEVGSVSVEPLAFISSKFNAYV